MIFGSFDGIYLLDPDNRFSYEKLIPLDLKAYNFDGQIDFEFWFHGKRDQIYTVLSNDNNFLYYQVKKYAAGKEHIQSNELFKYGFKNGNVIKMAELTGLKTKRNNGKEENLNYYAFTGISGDETYVFLQDDGESMILNLKTKAVERICEIGTQCKDAIFSN